MGVEALGLGLGTLIHELGVKPAHRHRPRFPLLFGVDQDGADERADRRGLHGARHRARAHADGLFRAVRARRAVRRHGHRLAQRQWLDRREDGRQPPAHLRSRRDDAAQGHRARPRNSRCAAGGAYAFVENFPARYIADLTKRPKLKRHLKVVCACGNGTAGAFAPQVLEEIGCEVVPLDCELDHTFPNYNPNTEDMKMLHAMRDAVLASKADVGLGLRRRRRPLRRGRQRGRGNFRRQGRRHAGARHLGQSQERAVRRRREIDRPVHDRSGADQERRQDRLLEDRPFLHEAPRQRDRRHRRLREIRPLLLQQAVRPRL